MTPAERAALALAALEEQDAEVAAQREEDRASALEALVKVRAEFGPRGAELVETAYGCVVVRRPDPLKFKRFIAEATREDVSLEKAEAFVRPCVVYPSLSAFDAMAAEAPGIVGSVALAVGRLGGAQAEIRAGK